MLEYQSYLVEDSEYWRLAGNGLSKNQRIIYEYLFRNRVFKENAKSNSRIAKALGMASSNCFASLQDMVDKKVVYSEDKLYWVKQIPKISKAKIMADKEINHYLKREDEKTYLFYKEMRYVEDDLYELFGFISPENVDKFVQIYTAKMEKNQKRVKHLLELKEKYEKEYKRDCDN